MRIASETDLAALEYAATVLSVELARLQSVAEAELRSQRNFAEELLAGADESTVKASAHVLGYDPHRPHRVIIATGRPRGGLDEQFFQAVVRHVRRLDVGSLVVARTDYVVIIAYRQPGRDAASQGRSLVIGRVDRPPLTWRNAGAMAPGSRPRDHAASLKGRSHELSVLGTFLDVVRASGSRVLVVRGEPGVGKTALLDYLAGRASGCLVARAAGAQPEMELAFAGLHQLCAPMLDHAERLSAPQREALRIAFGIGAGPAPDRFLVGLAVLGLLSEVAAERRYCALSMTRSGLTGPRRRLWRS